MTKKKSTPAPAKKSGSPAKAKKKAAKSPTGTARVKAKTTRTKKSPAAKARKSQRATVADFMTGTVTVIRSDESLAAAARKMWHGDFGSLPVLDGDAALCGWITDRDICMALAMQRAGAAEVGVDQVMTGPVHRCRTTDPVSVALDTMAHKQVRRLAVVDDADELVGVISLVDVIRTAKGRSSAGAPSATEVLDALRGVTRPHEVTEKT